MKKKLPHKTKKRTIKKYYDDSEVEKYIPKELTHKQALFLKYYLKTGNGVRSALKAYDTDNYGSASQIATENLVKLKEPIKTFMEHHDLSLGRLVRVIKDATDATKKTAIIDGRDEKGHPTYEYVDEPHHEIRIKATEVAAKWLGLEHSVSEKPQVQLNQFNFGSAPQKLLDTFREFVKSNGELVAETK